ncbi:MAG: hypothetical protein FJ033_15285 [Chloroflexi bacterium]|nr:hypothetical protein [Chloroflexota bacterium]
MVVHSPFGSGVNRAWALAIGDALKEQYGLDAQTNVGDDGFLLRFGGAESPPGAEVVARLTSAEARERLLRALPASELFGARFRENAARALVLPRTSGGRRTPLWLSRLRAKDLQQATGALADFPITIETYRDCLADILDLGALTEVLDAIASGEITVVGRVGEAPSGVAAGLDYRFAMQYMYEHDAPRGERQFAALNVSRALLGELLRDGSLASLAQPEAIEDVVARVERRAADYRLEQPTDLLQALFELGDMTTDEIARASEGDTYAGWLAALAGRQQIVSLRIGEETRWVHADRFAEYRALGDDPRPILVRAALARGITDTPTLARRYLVSEAVVQESLQADPGLLRGRVGPGAEEQWVERSALDQIHRRSLAILRRAIEPVPLGAYAHFLLDWQGIRRGSAPREDEAAAVEESQRRLTRILQQLRGFGAPLTTWMRDILPDRLGDEGQAGVEHLLQSGELIWAIDRGNDPRRARVRFMFRGEGRMFLEPMPTGEGQRETAPARADRDEAVVRLREGAGSQFSPKIVEGFIRATQTSPIRTASTESALGRIPGH